MTKTKSRCAIRPALVLLLGLSLSCANADEDIATQSIGEQGSGKADGVEQGNEVEVPDGADVLADQYALIIDTWLKTAESDDDDEPQEWRAQLRARLERYSS
ncbi:MAG: hypothetical protein VYA30_01680, partial [Myxococcota bacterium]|nr:hypothetical protein [Myxococcota bacterium]